jgi:hypothetical protein
VIRIDWTAISHSDRREDGSLLSFHIPDMDEHAGFRHPGRNLDELRPH